MQEIFLPLNDNLEMFNNIYKNTYIVSNYGYIMDKEKILSTYIDKSNNLICNLYGPNRFQKSFNVKKIVMVTFVPRDDYDNHKILNVNYDGTNCRLDNLYWDDGLTYNNKLLLMHDIPKLDTINGESWTPLGPYGYLNDVITDGWYASTLGRFYNLKRKTYSYGSKWSSEKEYLRIDFISNTEPGKRVHKLAHRVILNAFCYNENYNILQVNHKNGNQTDNRLCNLEWVTSYDNINHAYVNNLNNYYGESNHLTKYNYDIIQNILDLYINTGNLLNDIHEYSLSIINCNNRLHDISNYMIIHNWIPSILFTKDEYNELIKLISVSSTLQIFISNIQYILKNNRIKEIACKLIYSIIKTNNWDNYPNL